MIDALPDRDLFGSVAAKWQYLFRLDRDSRVLLVGDGLNRADFARFFNSVTCWSSDDLHGKPRATDSDRYDFVWIDLRAVRDARATDVAFLCGELLAPSGTAMVSLNNRFSLAGAKAMTRLRRHSRNGRAPWHVARAFAKAGFHRTQLFMANADGDTPTDMLGERADTMDLARERGATAQALARLGLYRYVHDRYAILASRDTEILSHLTCYVSHRLMVEKAIPELAVERVVLRERGALVVIVKDKANGRRYVCRAASSDVTEVISRNTSILRRIRALSGLPSSFRQLLPEPLIAGSHRGAKIFVETAMPGVLAWKLAARPAVEKQILADALAFSITLGRATRKSLVIDETAYERLLGRELQRLGAAFGSQAQLAETRLLDRAFRSLLLGRKLFVVWAHGDYGYGNLLCDPRTGELEGIIDWDTARMFDMPGVDYLNLLLQRSRSRFAGSIAAALEALFRDLESSESPVEQALRAHASTFSLTKTGFRVNICIAAIRIMSRAIPYRAEFVRDAVHFRAALDFIGKALAARRDVVRSA